MNNNKILVPALCIVVAGFAFAGGMQFQKGKPQNAQQLQGAGGQFRQRNGAGQQGARSVRGEILSADDKSITVKMTDGSSKIILLTGKTTISKATEGLVSDLKTGVTVAVFGTDNTDGSVTATNVQLNPGFGGPNGARTMNDKQKSADAKEYMIEGSNYKFSPITISVKKGEKSRIVLKNTEGMHDFVVDELNLKTNIIQGNQEDFVEFTPEKAGTFEFYCSVGNHRAMGMKGTLIVTE